MPPLAANPLDNPFKRGLGSGPPLIGLWSSLCSNLAADALADAGFDWIVLDGEHAPNTLPSLLGQMQALAGGTAEPVVRVPVNDAALIKRVLDLGARTILVPMVNTEEDAILAAAAVAYPPDGVRGVALATRANRFGRVPDYHARARDGVCLILQIETREALDAMPAIARVPGVDALFLGPSDLAADLGHLGRPGAPAVWEALARAVAVGAETGMPLGTLMPAEADARRCLDMGFRFVAVGSDMGLLARGADALAAKFKEDGR